MKRVYYLLVMLLAFTFTTGNLMAQDVDAQQMTKKEAKKAKREAKKKFENVKDQFLFQKAVEALKAQSFLIKVDQLIYPRGRAQFVTTQTNFIYVNGDKAVIQIAPSNMAAGPNGVGGITVEGRPSDIKISTDKKGNVYYEFMDQGIAVSASVNIQMANGTNRVTATISPNFNNNDLTVSGLLVPFQASEIYQGRTI